MAQDPTDAYAQALRALWEAAGKPTGAAIERQAAAQTPPLVVSPKSWSDWLNGKNVPSKAQIARFLLAYLRGQVPKTSEYVPAPDAWWETTRRQAMEHRRAGPGRGGRPPRPHPLPAHASSSTDDDTAVHVHGGSDRESAASQLVDGVPVEIVAAVQRAYTDLVEKAGDGIDLPRPSRWTRLELRVLRDAADTCVPADWPELRRRADTLVAWCDTAIASPVLTEIGIDRIRLERLQGIYRAAVERWPDGGSATAMVTEAAHAAIVERRGAWGIDLTSLARFVLGLAACRGVGMNVPALAEWVRVTGHQVADAEAYLASLADRVAWLLIDLDDEPLRDGDPLWPRTLTSQLCTSGWDKDGENLPIADHEICESAEDLEHALRRLLSRVNLPATVFVDVVAPRALLDSGIENLEIMQVDDDEYEPLTAGYRPRLRWSKRRTDQRSYERLQRRSAAAVWRNDVAVFSHGHGAEKRQILDWLRRHSRHPVVLGSARHGTVDPLRIMLREGCGFVLWFPAGLDPETISEVNAVAGRVPVAARKAVIPDELAVVSARPMILWDDPHGREDVRLPRIVRLQSPDS